MSTAMQFPLRSFDPRRARPPRSAALVAAVAAALLAALAAPPVRADDNILRGPHPFLRENEFSAHVLVAAGIGSAPSGTKLGLDYGYKIASPMWLDIGLNLQHGSCETAPGQPACAPDVGDAFETLVGVKWKWATAIPVVPYAQAAAGMVFVFPSSARSALGFAARVAGGANYFFFDWLGVGGQVGYSLGRVSYDAAPTVSPAYNVFDFGAGVELQF
jgi:hypothetical protein